jgi:folate-binding protein YgfZ
MAIRGPEYFFEKLVICATARLGYIGSMTELHYVRLDNRQVLKITGDDARGFLQGLVSNDLERVSPRHAIYAALLTPQGKYLHDFFIAELSGAFYLDCEAARIDDLFKRLRMYKLRANVEIEIAEELAVAVMFGDDIHDALALDPTLGAAMEWLGGVIYTDPRLSEIGTRAILPNSSLEIALHDEALIPAPFEDYDQLRLALGLPDGSRDLEIDKSTLLECGFEELHGVDFQKGCYMGQELTARTKHRGLVKKRLIPVSFNGDALAAGAEITQAGKNAGEIRSTADGQGLALVRLESLADPAPLMVGDIPVTPNKPAWANF